MSCTLVNYVNDTLGRPDTILMAAVLARQYAHDPRVLARLYAHDPRVLARQYAHDTTVITGHYAYGNSPSQTFYS